MAIMNPKTALENETISDFGGICDHAGLTSKGAMDMRNFRILSDGTLEKRCGFSKQYSFGAPVRGLWEGSVSGGTYLFAVSGNRIFRKGHRDATPVAIYTLPTSEGAVSFAYYSERLYLFDGATVLIFQSSTESFSVAEGYTPLYGKNWHPTQLGEIHEPLNLIQDKIRVHYFNSNGSTTFNLPFTCAQIHTVRVNGSTTNLYSFTPNTSSFTIPATLSTVGSVEVTATLDYAFSSRNNVLTASNATVFLTPHHQTLMTFGGSLGYYVYRTAPVSEEMLKECRLTCTGADPLYFQKDTVFAVGSSQHPIQALCQLDNQMLVLNDQNIWAIRYSNYTDEEAEILPIRAPVGCSSPRGAILCDGRPVTAGDGGILQLRFPSDDPNLCDASPLSWQISERLSTELLHRAVLFWNRAHNQLWVRDPQDTEGLVWVFDLDRKLWFCYDGILANHFFEWDGKVWFSTDAGDVYFFDETSDTDCGKAFSAYYVSHYLALSHPEFAKRSLRLSLFAQPNGGTITTRLKTERGEKSFLFSDNALQIPSFFDRRLAMGRFRLLQFRLSTDDSARCRIYSLSIAANN